MEFSIEKYISQFVQNQFPRFYQEEGENFMLFVKAYYEYMETESTDHQIPNGGPVAEARELLSYRDIDSTLEKFLEFFQKKYLYGIPFNVITSKRFLLKHILDVYRSKGTIQCYRLLFKLIYDEDIQIYLPGRDILKASDGTWIEPLYLELSEGENLNNYIGKSIVGVSSGTTAVVENYVKESFNYDIVNTMYISNMAPKGGDFFVGESVVLQSDLGNNEVISSAPVVLGSLDYLEIINGGQNFNIGDILKISNKDITTNQINNYGSDGYIKVSSLSKGFGTLNFNIVKGGFGFTTNANIFIYNNQNDYTGNGASFNVSSLSSTRNIEYNTDLICDRPDIAINAATYGFAANASGNSATPISNLFSYSNSVFGSIFSLSDIVTGNGYVAPANVFVRSTLLSNLMIGNVSYESGSMRLHSMAYVGSVNAPYTNGDILTVINENNEAIDLSEIRTNNPGEIHTLTLTSNGYVKNIIANSFGINSTLNLINITAANTYFAKWDRVYYTVPAGNTVINNLTANTTYYVNFSNTTCISISDLRDIKISESRTDSPAESHSLTLFSNGYTSTVTANTTGVDSYNGLIISSANTNFSKGDKVYYNVPAGNTAINGLLANNVYYVNFSNSSVVVLGNTVPKTNATVIISTNASGGDLTFTVTNRGTNFVSNLSLITNNTSTGNGAFWRPMYKHCVEGDGTTFTRFLVENDIIQLTANSFLSSNTELQVIKEVANNEFLWLYGSTKYTSTSSAQYRVAPVILPSNFAFYDEIVVRPDGSTAGINEFITASPASGNDVVGSVKLVGSGKGYSNGQIVTAYLYGGVSNNISIEIPGSGYQTGDALVFSGGDSGTAATGYIVANLTSGAVENTVITFAGSGYSRIPNVRIQSNTGSGASLTASISEFNTSSEIVGRVVKKGSGKGRGFWNTTRGFLNSDKYIQDSYYYQDYSYEISVARVLDDYKKILYNTFHTTGNELFGKYFVLNRESSNVEIVFESTNAIINPNNYLTVDSIEFKVDSTSITVDEYIEP